MLKSLELSDYMLASPLATRPEMSVYEAAQQILKHKVTGLVVTDEQEQLLGVLSELDCLRELLVSVYNNAEFGGKPVGDIMTREVLHHQPGDSIVSIAEDMLKHSHRRRPVVEDGKLVGQVTCRQILKVVTQGLDKRRS